MHNRQIFYSLFQSTDIVRCRSAASTHNRGSRPHNILHLLGKGIRIHVIDGVSILIKRWQPGIWLCNDRYRGYRCHLFDKIDHLIRTG